MFGEFDGNASRRRRHIIELVLGDPSPELGGVATAHGSVGTGDPQGVTLADQQRETDLFPCFEGISAGYFQPCIQP
jgi:hypothetical protein